MKRLHCLGCCEGDVVELHDHTGQTVRQEKQRRNPGDLRSEQQEWVVVETTLILKVYINSSWLCNESDQDLKL